MANSKKFNTLIFDFDGTLADTLEVVFIIANNAAKKFGFKQIQRDDLARFRNSHWKNLLDEFEVGLAKLPFILRFVQKEMKGHMDEVNSFDGVPEMLLKLNASGIRLGILSSNKTANINEFLKRHKLDGYFDFVHSEKNLFGKDKALKRILKKHGLNKKGVLYVGDEVRDIEGAKRAGIKVAAVTWGYNNEDILRKHGPDFIVKKPNEIEDLTYSKD